ncbi:hypothetical protein SPF06_07830 [Sinomonas sp. JGH33]|uniref:DUF3267 domain-containing protein n=1 Tax=Sinomonas terricola TaxID=3110330 RepID=A0ABU5T4N8_9MICC|nr:hypothetical protein [Sinomonas sp. JGH33]MEA5454629.1 hypothetical protein [Sinomonas sp. JGH33]
MAFPALAIAVSSTSSTFRRDLLDLGLASETAEHGLLRLVFGASPSRAKALPGGWVPSVAAALVHYGLSMSRVVGLLGLVFAAGLGTGATSLAGLALGGLLLVGSALVHELGHVVAYRLAGGPGAPAIAVAKGMKCHLVRRRLSPRRDLLVAAAGPLAPGLLVLPAVPLVWIAPLAFAAWIAIALGHALCALCPVGDGLTIWVALAQLRRERRAAADTRT